MRRREFITLLGCAAAAWPSAVGAQQPAMPVIGYLGPTEPNASGRLLTVLRESLAEAGYVEGRTVAIEYRWAEGRYDRLPGLAAELVRRQVAAMVASPTPTAVAAKAASATVPIVFGMTDDPVKLGHVGNLARPGGNATGVYFFLDNLAAKQLGLLRELVPAAPRIGLMINPQNANAEGITREMAAAASAIGVQIEVVPASDIEAIHAAFATLTRNNAGALVVAADPLLFQPSGPVRHAGGPPRDSRRPHGARVLRSGLPDELRHEPHRGISADRHLYRPHPQGRQARRPAGRPVDEIRLRHQFDHRQGTRPRYSTNATRPRRRGDRMIRRREFITLLGGAAA